MVPRKPNPKLLWKRRLTLWLTEDRENKKATRRSPFRDWPCDGPQEEVTASARSEEVAPPSTIHTLADRHGTKITRHWITSFQLLNSRSDYEGDPARLASISFGEAVREGAFELQLTEN